MPESPPTFGGVSLGDPCRLLQRESLTFMSEEARSYLAVGSFGQGVPRRWWLLTKPCADRWVTLPCVTLWGSTSVAANPFSAHVLLFLQDHYVSVATPKSTPLGGQLTVLVSWLAQCRIYNLRTVRTRHSPSKPSSRVLQPSLSAVDLQPPAP